MLFYSLFLKKGFVLICLIELKSQNLSNLILKIQMIFKVAKNEYFDCLLGDIKLLKKILQKN